MTQDVAAKHERLNSVCRVSLIEVILTRGEGTVNDPVRTVTALFDDDGRCVAEHDPCYPTPWYAPPDVCVQTRHRGAAATPATGGGHDFG